MKAYVVEKNENNEFISGVKNIEVPAIDENEVLIKVTYSSLNFKDALSSVGNPGVTRVFPHVTGIDVSGIIEKSNSSEFKIGDAVLVTGYDLGMNTNGGHAEFVRVPSSWVVKIPNGISDKEIMTYGTAGLTAALSVNELLNNNVTSGNVLVTGATGGVGSIAVSILNKLGFHVTAISGKEDKIPFLKEIGADEVILRNEFNKQSTKPMMSEKYSGVVDTVGGEILANVFPFILRGVRLIGIDSVECAREQKIASWKKIAGDFKIDNLDNLTNEISLDEIKDAYKALLEGKAVGRYLVKIS